MQGPIQLDASRSTMPLWLADMAHEPHPFLAIQGRSKLDTRKISLNAGTVTANLSINGGPQASTRLGQRWKPRLRFQANFFRG